MVSSRPGFLQQNAFHKNDTYVPLDKQMWLMEAILHLYDRAVELVDKGVPVSAMADAGPVSYTHLKIFLRK